NAVTRAAVVAGQTATVAGRVADDSRAASGGSEVLVEPDIVLVGGVPAPNIGNLMVRWRGPQVAGFGDQINATGRLVLPRDLPSFDRRAYLAQRHAYLELDTTSINVTNPSTGLTALPAWLRTRYTAALPHRPLRTRRWRDAGRDPCRRDGRNGPLGRESWAPIACVDFARNHRSRDACLEARARMGRWVSAVVRRHDRNHPAHSRHRK